MYLMKLPVVHYSESFERSLMLRSELHLLHLCHVCRICASGHISDCYLRRRRRREACENISSFADVFWMSKSRSAFLFSYIYIYSSSSIKVKDGMKGDEQELVKRLTGGRSEPVGHHQSVSPKGRLHCVIACVVLRGCGIRCLWSFAHTMKSNSGMY